MSKFIPRSKVQADRMRQAGIARAQERRSKVYLWPDSKKGPLALNALELSVIEGLSADEQHGLRVMCESFQTERELGKRQMKDIAERWDAALAAAKAKVSR